MVRISSSSSPSRYSTTMLLLVRRDALVRSGSVASGARQPAPLLQLRHARVEPRLLLRASGHERRELLLQLFEAAASGFRASRSARSCARVEISSRTIACSSARSSGVMPRVMSRWNAAKLHAADVGAARFGGGERARGHLPARRASSPDRSTRSRCRRADARAFGIDRHLRGQAIDRRDRPRSNSLRASSGWVSLRSASPTRTAARQVEILALDLRGGGR